MFLSGERWPYNSSPTIHVDHVAYKMPASFDVEGYLMKDGKAKEILVLMQLRGP